MVNITGRPSDRKETTDKTQTFTLSTPQAVRRNVVGSSTTGGKVDLDAAVINVLVEDTTLNEARCNRALEDPPREEEEHGALPVLRLGVTPVVKR